MVLKNDLETEVAAIFRKKWEERDGTAIPDDKSLTLSNSAVKLDATVLYADLADSTTQIESVKPFAAVVPRNRDAVPLSRVKRISYAPLSKNPFCTEMSRTGFHVFGQKVVSSSARKHPSVGKRCLDCGRFAMALVCLWGLLGSPAQAYANVAPIDVAVNGQKIAYDDFRDLVKGVLAAHINQVTKNPAEMPPAAPLVYYAGNRTVWVSKSVDQDLGTFANVSPAAQPGEDAFLAATALAAMDVGTAGQTWEALYNRAAPTTAARIALGKAVVSAWKSASDQSAEFEAAQNSWMLSSITVGMPRTDVYSALKSHGLIPYNTAYESLKPSEGCLPPFRDANSGTWPKPNEAIPPSEGICAKLSAGRSPEPNPKAYVYIVGAFGLGCDQASETAITFGSDDRVSKVDVDNHRGGCV